jgi:hypothetical protein
MILQRMGGFTNDGRIYNGWMDGFTPDEWIIYNGWVDYFTTDGWIHNERVALQQQVARCLFSRTVITLDSMRHLYPCF